MYELVVDGAFYSIWRYDSGGWTAFRTVELDTYHYGTSTSRLVKDLLTCLPKGEEVQGVKIFTIAYGKDADMKLFKQIADRTNSKTFAAEPATIEQVYALISAEE